MIILSYLNEPMNTLLIVMTFFDIKAFFFSMSLLRHICREFLWQPFIYMSSGNCILNLMYKLNFTYQFFIIIFMPHYIIQQQ
jgi:hypothetical protein